METVRYSRGRLLGAALFMAVIAVWFLLIFLDPDAAGHSRRGRFLHTSFGHYVFVPGIALCGALGAWRFASTAFGDLKALETTPAGLVVASFWGKRKIAWHDLVDVAIKSVRSGFWTQHQLLLKTRVSGLFGGRAVRVPLAGTGLSEAAVKSLLYSIMQARSRALSSPQTESGPVAGDIDASSDFDADAALARYMARKASGMIQASALEPETPAAAPQPRPVFGRKGL